MLRKEKLLLNVVMCMNTYGMSMYRIYLSKRDFICIVKKITIYILEFTDV